MKQLALLIVATGLVVACATAESEDPLDLYEEIDATTILDAPKPVPGRYSPIKRDLVLRGEYLVELLGCYKMTASKGYYPIYLTTSSRIIATQCLRFHQQLG